MSKLVDLLRDLGKDADLCEAYKENPDAVMQRYELTDEQCAAMKSGNVDAVKEACGLQTLGLSNGVITSYD